jgi:hypothetical protein
MTFITKALTLLILCLALSMTSAKNMRGFAEPDQRFLQDGETNLADTATGLASTIAGVTDGFNTVQDAASDVGNVI